MSMKSLERIVVATVNGRAYYTFLTLLTKMGLKFESRLPWDPSVYGAHILLTTKDEVPRGYSGEVLFYEELEGDEIKDRAKILFKLRPGESILIGIDPGKHIGMACIYGGFLMWEGSLLDVESVVEIVKKLVKLPARSHIIRIGNGRPELARKIASLISSYLGSFDHIEMVDERGTTLEGRKRSEKDVKAAYRIAIRRGRELG